MSDDRPMMIITCACGQKMRVPADSPGKVYKCVKCGAHVRVRLPGARPVLSESPETASMDLADEPVGQMLCEAGVISREDLMEALARQRARGGKTFDVLIGMGALTADQLHDFLSRQPGVAAIDLARFQVDRKLLEIIPKRMAQEALVLPIDQLGKLLTVAMACPLDTATIREIETVTGSKVKAVLCRLGDINDAVKKYYPDPEEDDHDSALRRFMEEEQGPPREDAGAKIAKIDTLGILPQTAKRLAALGGDDDSALLDTAAIAETDPLFAASLLRTANSAAYGLAGRVDSVAMAVTILDRDGAISASRLGAGAGISDARIEPILRRACRCAAGTAALARITNRAGAGAAYTAGLLHEMGCFALAVVSPRKFFEIDPDLTGDERIRMERKYFTASYIEAGASLAARWRLPDNLCLAIRHVLTPLKAGKARDLAAMVSLAALAAARPNQLIPALFTGRDDAIRHLAMDMSQLIQTLDAAMREA